MEDYKKYQKELGEIPEFLNKYLNLDVMQRLKGVSLFCGMNYASPYMYDFSLNISRYDHSLNVALITWRLTHDKTQTLAALFHDVSTPVFSHVIDFMNGDYIEQESTEDKIRDVLLSSRNLLTYLKEDNISLEDVMDFKKHSIVDLPRPSLCADRIENTIGGGMGWANKVDYKHAKDILDNLYVDKNENGQDEISLLSKDVGEYVLYINDCLNKLTHKDEDSYMMDLLADLVRLTINEGIIIYDDLYRLTEEEFFNIIEKYLYISDINDYYHLFKTVKDPLCMKHVIVKNRVVNPIVNGKRMI